MVFKKRTKNQQPSVSDAPGGTVSVLKPSSKRRKIVFVGAIFLVVLVAAVAAWIISNEDEVADSSKSKQTYAQEFLDSDKSDATQSRLVEQYGEQYDENAAKLSKSNPAEWDKAMLDTAYAALLYTDKMSAYTQADLYLTYIKVAQSNGLDIDDNSYGVTQETRDLISQRSKAWTKKNTEKVKVKIEVAQ
jgi:hypothetical protein